MPLAKNVAKKPLKNKCFEGGEADMTRNEENEESF